MSDAIDCPEDEFDEDGYTTDTYCIEEDLEESMQREKRLEELVEDMYHLLLKLCISGHDLCLKYGSCDNCPVAEILKKAREK